MITKIRFRQVGEQISIHHVQDLNTPVRSLGARMACSK
jgi:hypothetical protein